MQPEIFPFTQAHLTKSEVGKFASMTVQSILEDGNVVRVAENLAAMELFIKEVKARPEYIDYLRDEISKYGKSLTLPTGTKLELAEVGVKYDYSRCKDPILSELTVKAEAIDSEIKARQEFLKSLPLPGIELAHDDELVHIYPPSRLSTSSVKTTLSK